MVKINQFLMSLKNNKICTIWNKYKAKNSFTATYLFLPKMDGQLTKKQQQKERRVP